MKTILALVDFSDITATVLAQTQSLAKAFSARVILVHAIRQEPLVLDAGLASPTPMQPPREEVIQAGRAKLQELKDAMAAAGITVTAKQLPDATMAGILGESRRLEADMIVVGSHPHSPLYDLFIGSFTRDLLRLAHCPVLVVPADEGADSN